MILQNKFFWILQSKPKKSPTSILNKYPIGLTQTYSQKKKKKKNQPKPNTNMCPPQSSNGKAKT